MRTGTWIVLLTIPFIVALAPVAIVVSPLVGIVFLAIWIAKRSERAADLKRFYSSQRSTVAMPYGPVYRDGQYWYFDGRTWWIHS